jgi:hypothetical protein
MMMMMITITMMMMIMMMNDDDDNFLTIKPHMHALKSFHIPALCNPMSASETIALFGSSCCEGTTPNVCV